MVAIRGLGGFHLACDATNAEAVQRLRRRKHRYGKPFALMARDLDMIRRYCNLTPVHAELLQSPEAPIVLIRPTVPRSCRRHRTRSERRRLHAAVHAAALLITQIDQPLVMTSGNISDEPQVTSLDRARSGLRGIADAMLMHNRDRKPDRRFGRADRGWQAVADSPCPRLCAQCRVVTPAGFDGAPDLLAFGGELKATFCVVKDGAAILSQHQGDLEDVSTFEDYQKNLQLYSKIYDHRPRMLVADMHPEYLSAKLAKQRSGDDKLPLLEVQHHHAHIASCMVKTDRA